jgi:glycosyltransferase involved in cell wall biosynthesis
MRILQVTHSLDPKAGGPVEHLKRLNPVLVNMGHHTEILCLDSPSAGWLSEHDVRVHPLGPGFLKYGYSPKLVGWLRDNASFFDAVIIRGLWQYTSLGTWIAMRGSGTPYYVFPHGMLDPWFEKQYPLKHLKKSVYWFIGGYPVLRDARAVLFTTHRERDLAENAFSPYRCHARVVAYGTEVPPITHMRKRDIFFKRFPSLADKRMILYLGRIHEKKGCDDLVRAFTAVADRDPKLRLVMAGPGNRGFSGRLRELAGRSGLSGRVVWTGMLEGDLKWGAFSAAEVFILPSHQENFGIAVAEALGCSTPVIITDKVNIWETVRRHNAGIIGEDNMKGTLDSLERWLGMDMRARQEMSVNAERCFFDNFHINTAAESLISVLRETG